MVCFESGPAAGKTDEVVCVCADATDTNAVAQIKNPSVAPARLHFARARCAKKFTETCGAIDGALKLIQKYLARVLRDSHHESHELPKAALGQISIFLNDWLENEFGGNPA
jgi:hypothetical protein